MKNSILLFVAFLVHTVVFSQQFSVKGKVVNQSNQPVEFVFVSLLQKDSLIVQSATDSLGIFSIMANGGSYHLVLDQFGTEFLRKDITIDKDTDLKNLQVNESVQLEGLTITSKKKLIEQKVDRLVYNVENAVTATGGTALDALKSTPTVRVQNDNVSIVGKGQVMVMIDERIQRMSQEDMTVFLKSIPADNIKSIEVITTPPAKYDAEGNSGLINIKLKKAKANSWNANIGASYTQRTYASENAQGLFTYNYNKLSFEASFNKGKEKLYTTSESRIFYNDGLWKENVANKSESDLLSVGFGLDYKLGTKWTTGVKYLGSFTDKTLSNNPFITRYDNAENTASSYIFSSVNAGNKPKMNSLNWYNSFALDSLNKNITVDMDYFNYRKEDFRTFSGNELDRHRSTVPGTFFSATSNNLNKIENYSGKIDVSLPYEWANISFGGKAYYANTDNNLVVFDNETGIPVLNTNQSNKFNYKEYNQALYFSAGKKLGDKWETQLGIRMESTQTKGYSENLDQTNKTSYTKLFPTAYITYVPNDNNSFSLNYSRRIRRPDFDYLNPFVIRSSPYYYSEGNPYLKPSYIDNLEFSYIKNQKWVSSVYFSKVSNFGQELSIVDQSTNITRNAPLNYADTYQVGLSSHYNFSSFEWWNSFTGFNVNYQNVQSKSEFFQSIDGFNGYIYSNNDFILNKQKTVFVGMNYGLQLPGRYQIFNISTLNILDISVKLLAFNKNLSITLVGEDLLNAQKPLIEYYSNGIKNNVKSYSDTKAFRISLSYKFGNKATAPKQRSFGSEDEMGRTGN